MVNKKVLWLMLVRLIVNCIYGVAMYVGASLALNILPHYLEFTWLPAKVLYVIIGGGVFLYAFEYVGHFVNFCANGLMFSLMNEDSPSIGMALKRLVSKFLSVSVFIAIYRWIESNIMALVAKVKDGTSDIKLPIALPKTLLDIGTGSLYNVFSYFDECAEYEIMNGCTNLLDSCALAAMTYMKNITKFIKLGFQKVLCSKGLSFFVWITAFALLYYRLSFASMLYLIVGTRILIYLMDDCILEPLFVVRFVHLYKSVRESSKANHSNVDDVLVDGDDSSAQTQTVSMPEGIVDTDALKAAIEKFMR